MAENQNTMLSQISPCLWFDGQAEEAANFYTSIFKGGKINHVQRYNDAGMEAHGQKPGSAMVVSFELNGHSFTALNGGPQFKFSPAISFQIECADQEEVDHYWDKLKDGGDPTKQRCGWVEDKFGVSWQVIPKALFKMIADTNPEKSKRTYEAMMGMQKFDIAVLERVFRDG
jgi:predicted 3-demethylubiquinone-9 3-methyltransferase (glyoxalase superfamily)